MKKPGKRRAPAVVRKNSIPTYFSPVSHCYIPLAWSTGLNFRCRLLLILKRFKRHKILTRDNATAIVVAHLLVNIAHGLAHRELGVGLAPLNLLAFRLSSKGQQVKVTSTDN